MGLNPCLWLIALAITLSSCSVEGVQNDTNASALLGNGKEGHNRPKVIFAYVAFAVGGTLMFVGFIYLIVWALTAKDTQESPEPRPKGHGIYMDQDITGRKTAPENVGGGEELKYDPDTYLPIITVSDVPGASNAYVNSYETGYRIEQESKSDGDMQQNNNLLQVANPPRRHSAEDTMPKTKRHSIEHGKNRHSQQSHTQKDSLAGNSAMLIAADRRSSIESGGRHSPTRRGRRHSDISAVSSSSRGSSLHDELSRRRASNISISEVETGTGEEDVRRHSSESNHPLHPKDSSEHRRDSLNVENLHESESNTDSLRFKHDDVHYIASEKRASKTSARNSREEKRKSIESKRSSQQYQNDMYQPKRSSVQHEDVVTNAKRNSQQSDTPSEDSSGNMPRKKSWLYDRFAFRKKKKNKEGAKPGKREDGQSTDEGYSTIEGTPGNKDKPSLTKYSKKETADYSLLAVPLMATTRNNNSYQRSGATSSEYINKSDSQLETHTANVEEKAPENFQFRSAGSTFVTDGRESYRSDNNETDIRSDSQETATSHITNEASEANLYNDVAQVDHNDSEQVVNSSQSGEKTTEFAHRQSVAVSSVSYSSYQSDSLANASIKTTSSDGGPVAMTYYVQDGKITDDSKRSSILENHADNAYVSAGSMDTRQSVLSHDDHGEQITNSGLISNRNSNVQQPEHPTNDSKRSSILENHADNASLSAGSIVNRHSVQSHEDHGEQITNSGLISNRNSNVQQPERPSVDKRQSMESSNRGSVHSQNTEKIQSSESNGINKRHEDGTSLLTEQSDVQEKAASRSNSNESEGDFSYETAPSDTESQKYAVANVNRHSYNSGDSYASGSALESTKVSLRSASGSMNNRLSAGSSVLESKSTKLDVNDGIKVEDVISPDGTSIRSDDDGSRQSNRNSQPIGVPGTLDDHHDSVSPTSPPARPDSPVPIERIASDDDIIENEVNDQHSAAEAKFTPPPAPPPPTFYVPPPPPLPSMIFPRKTSSNDVPSLKPVKSRDSPQSGGSSSPMPFMEELAKRLQKYSDPKVDHGAATVNVSKVLDDKSSDNSSNIETIVKENEPLLYGGTSPSQGNDIRDGNNSSLSNESEMSIPQAIESGDDTAPQSPELPEGGSNGGSDISSEIADSQSALEGGDSALPIDKRVEFRETVSHIPSPASSFSISESQLAMYDGRPSDFFPGANKPSSAKRSDYPKEKYPNLLHNITPKRDDLTRDNVKVSSNHPDDVDSASDAVSTSNSSVIHQESSAQASEQRTVMPSAGNGNQKPSLSKPNESEKKLPQQEEFDYPSDNIDVPMEGTNIYMY